MVTPFSYALTQHFYSKGDDKKPNMEDLEFLF